eukprot:TRINITY_DN762_c1_g1_i1.p1 TRINITY_DN762_c1_g1~~TRINITY_DN762_c1_g1_i1.p1  ORF type:complete len:323 (+),score=58.55 TRINITY_DN762_c1_g1_i1:145-969(+)
MGVDVNSNRVDGIQAALNAVAASDVAVLVLGIDKTIEHEGIDRVNTTLPGLQNEFALKVLSIGKPTVIVLVNGGILSIDDLVNASAAIVEAFNPSVQGARALADTLFGTQNRWGKLPVTIYPADYINQVVMTNYDMSKPPGRTYRYYTGTPLFPFGYGLSLTTFDVSCKQIRPTVFQCVISNTGKLDGDEVVMLYHSAGQDIRKKVVHPVPIKQLVQYERFSVGVGKSVTHTFSLTLDAFRLTNIVGDKVLYGGQHFIFISHGNGNDLQFEVTL